MINATVVGKVQEVKEFGECVKVTLVHFEGKDSGYASQFIDIIAKRDSWQGKQLSILKKDDDNIVVVGPLKKEPWKNNKDRFDMVIKWPSEVQVPWSIRESRTTVAAPAAKAAPKKTVKAPEPVEQEADGLDDIPF